MKVGGGGGGGVAHPAPPAPTPLYYTTCIAHLFLPPKCESRQNRSIKYAYLIVTVRYFTKVLGKMPGRNCCHKCIFFECLNDRSVYIASVVASK